MQVRSPTTIAILGGNTVAGLALSFSTEGRRLRNDHPQSSADQETCSGTWTCCSSRPTWTTSGARRASPSSEAPRRACTFQSSPSALPSRRTYSPGDRRLVLARGDRGACTGDRGHPQGRHGDWAGYRSQPRRRSGATLDRLPHGLYRHGFPLQIRIKLRKYRKWGMFETSQGRRMVE